MRGAPAKRFAGASLLWIGGSYMRWKKIKKILMRDWQYYLFMLLPVAYIIVFAYVPMVGVQLAFRKYTARGGPWGSKWIWFDNFIKFFNSYQFSRVVGNTLILSVYGLATSTVVPICFALIVNTIESTKFKKVTQTIVNLPHFISVVVLVGILMQLFNNRTGVYGSLGMNLTGQYPPDLFGMQGTFRHMYIWSGVWQNFGWSSIIYIAALAGVDQELHEAAEIDGASRVQRIRYIDFPHITPTIVILLIMGIGSIMGVGFEKAYLMQNSLNLSKSELISTYVYKQGVAGTTGKTDVSYATAIGLFNSVVNLVLILIANTVSRKVTETSLW